MRALEARKPGFKFVMPLNGTHSQCISTGHGYLHTQLATFQPKLRTYLHGRLLDCHKIHRMVDDNIVPRTNQSILPRENNFSFNWDPYLLFKITSLDSIQDWYPFHPKYSSSAIRWLFFLQSTGRGFRSYQILQIFLTATWIYPRSANFKKKSLNRLI